MYLGYSNISYSHYSIKTIDLLTFLLSLATLESWANEQLEFDDKLSSLVGLTTHIDGYSSQREYRTMQVKVMMRIMIALARR